MEMFLFQIFLRNTLWRIYKYQTAPHFSEKYIRASSFLDIISTMPGKHEAVVSLIFCRNLTLEHALYSINAEKKQILPVPTCSLRSYHPHQISWNGSLVVPGTLIRIIVKAFFQSTSRWNCSIRLVTVSGTNILSTTLNSRIIKTDLQIIYLLIAWICKIQIIGFHFDNGFLGFKLIFEQAWMQVLNKVD